MRSEAQSEDSPPGVDQIEPAFADWKLHPFARGLAADHLAILARCAMPTRFEAGEVLFCEGEIANRFYLILKGRVLVELRPSGTDPVLVDEVRVGGVLGWSWMFPPYGWHFSARAAEATKAVFFYGTWLLEQCEENPALGYALIKRTAAVMLQRIEALSHRPGPA